MNEDANKLIKDLVVRGGTHSMVKLARLWAIVRNAGLAAQFGREEVVMKTTTQVSKSPPIDMFSATHKSISTEAGEEELDLKGVQRDPVT